MRIGEVVLQGVRIQRLRCFGASRERGRGLNILDQSLLQLVHETGLNRAAAQHTLNVVDKLLQAGGFRRPVLRNDGQRGVLEPDNLEAMAQPAVHLIAAVTQGDSEERIAGKRWIRRWRYLITKYIFKQQRLQELTNYALFDPLMMAPAG